jgi:NADH dehydrogenase
VAGVHAAYDFSPTNWTEIQRVNVDGSVTLFEQWRAAGMGRIIFVSSRSAGAAERSFYGRAKREIEKYCLSTGISVLRCGLVTSRGGRGLFGALERLVSRLPVIPLVGRGRQRLYLVRLEDFCEVTTYLMNRPAANAPIELAFSEPFTLREILSRIATSQKARRVFVPVPIWVIRTALRILATAGASMPFGEDNLDSLVAPGSPPDFAFLRAEHIAVQNPL